MLLASDADNHRYVAKAISYYPSMKMLETASLLMRRGSTRQRLSPAARWRLLLPAPTIAQTVADSEIGSALVRAKRNALSGNIDGQWPSCQQRDEHHRWR